MVKHHSSGTLLIVSGNGIYTEFYFPTLFETSPSRAIFIYFKYEQVDVFSNLNIYFKPGLQDLTVNSVVNGEKSKSPAVTVTLVGQWLMLNSSQISPYTKNVCVSSSWLSII